MEMDSGFWKGDSWQVVNIGRVSEVKISGEGQDFTYILFFLRESQGEDCSVRIADHFQSLSIPVEGKAQFLLSKFESYVKKLSYRTILEPADIALVVQSNQAQIPEFYKHAIQGEVTKIIQF